MKRIFAALMLLCAPLLAQNNGQTPQGPIYSYRLNGNNDAWIVGTIPQFVQPQSNGVPVLAPSNLYDSGTQLYYKGAPLSNNGGTVNNFMFPTQLGALFTCSVANPTVAPTVTCSVPTVTANSVYVSDSSGNQGYQTMPHFNGSNISNLISGQVSFAGSSNCGNVGYVYQPSTNTCILNGSGSGFVTPGVKGQAGGFPSPGSVISPLPQLYYIDSSMTLTDINTIFANAAAGSTIVLGAGVTTYPYTNANNLKVINWQQAVNLWELTQAGVVCDANEVVVSITNGSNQVYLPGSNTGIIGRSFAMGLNTGFGINAPQYLWVPTITDYNPGTGFATVSSNAPWTEGNNPVVLGTLNTTAMQLALSKSSYVFPLMIPSCGGILTGPLVWASGNSMQGMQPAGNAVYGLPYYDILQAPDNPVNGSVTAGNLFVKNVNFKVNALVNASRNGIIQYDGSTGSGTSLPALYRPLDVLLPDANNPLRSGWGTGVFNGVGNITQGSNILCYPTVTGARVPTVGQPLMFVNTPDIFTTTILNLTGTGCPTNFNGATLSSSVPNTSGYTLTQTEWFSGSAFQSVVTNIPTTVTFPFTACMSLPIVPSPQNEQTFATHGHMKVAKWGEVDYYGVNFTTNCVTIFRGPTAGPNTGNNTAAPMNPCEAKYEQPWPVIPTLNSGDSTPSGADYFPGHCGGNAAISFPSLNGNVHQPTGLVQANIEGNLIQPEPNGGPWQNQNATMCTYQAGNTGSYDSEFVDNTCLYTEYGMWQGPSSSGNHGNVGVQSTGQGNNYTHNTIRAGYPAGFTNLQGSNIYNLDTYSTSFNPFNGVQNGGSTCLTFANAFDEQTGGGVFFTNQIHLDNWACEPENGNHQEVAPDLIIDASNMTITQSNAEGGWQILGGNQLTWVGGDISPPLVIYGSQIDIQHPANLPVGYTTGTWFTPGGSTSNILNWGPFNTCSTWAGGTAGQGAQQTCTSGLTPSTNGRSLTPSMQGNETTAGWENEINGSIKPGSWQNNGQFDPAPMTKNFVFDPTEPRWSAHGECNFATNSLCRVAHFNAGLQGFMYIGSHNELAPIKYNIHADFKTVTAASSFLLNISTFDAGDGNCGSPGSVTNQTITTTTSWAPARIPVDFTGKSGCVLSIQFSTPSTSDTMWVGYFDFIPVPGEVNSPVATYTEGATCPQAGVILGVDTANQWVCSGNPSSAGVVKRIPLI